MPMFRTMHRTSIMLGILLLSGGAGADDLVGQASIIDGEEIHQKRIRLWGIDAPETSQLCRGADSDLYRCGAKAANDLDSFIAGRPVNCTPVAERPIWADCGNLFRRRCRHRRMACAQWSRAGLAAIFERQVRLRPARRRPFGPRDVGGQLRGAVAVSRRHQGWRHPDQLFGRCKRTSLSKQRIGPTVVKSVKSTSE